MYLVLCQEERIEMTEYIYGVHCGDSNCYACATQRYNCNNLNNLDTDNKDLEEDSSCDQCGKIPAKIEYKDKNYCTWYCAKKESK